MAHLKNWRTVSNEICRMLKLLTGHQMHEIKAILCKAVKNISLGMSVNGNPNKYLERAERHPQPMDDNQY